MTELLLLLLPLVPALAALAALLMPTARAALATSVFGVLAAAGLSGAAVWRTAVTGRVFAAGDWLFLDALSALHLVLMSLVFSISSLFARSYFREEIATGRLTLRQARTFGALWAGAASAMLLSLTANNMGLMWVGIEATTLLTAFLICFHRSRESLEAMWKYVLICSVGVGFAFMGTLLMAAAAARLNLDEGQVMLWTTLRSQAAALDPGLVKIAFIFLLTGYGVKAGLAPLHNWLPDAHSQAPAPVSALFSGFMLNAALYCILRWLPIVESVFGASGWGRELLTFFGLLSVLVAAGFVLFQTNVKRLLAYCSVEHLGIVALGVGLGGVGVFAGLFHAFNHSLAKTMSFCAAGRLGQKVGSHEMERLAGASAHSPFWGALLTVSFLALIGCAPFAMFFSELLTLKAALNAKAYWTAGLLSAGIGFIFIVMLRRIVELAWSRTTVPAASGTPESVPLGWGARCLLVLLTASVLLPGLWLPEAARNFLNQAADIVDVGRDIVNGVRP